MCYANDDDVVIVLRLNIFEPQEGKAMILGELLYADQVKPAFVVGYFAPGLIGIAGEMFGRDWHGRPIV